MPSEITAEELSKLPTPDPIKSLSPEDKEAWEAYRKGELPKLKQKLAEIDSPAAPPEDAKALEDAIEQLTQDANFAEAIGQASDRAFAADLRTVINAARSREQYATKQIQIQTPRIKAEAVREFIAEVEKEIVEPSDDDLFDGHQLLTTGSVLEVMQTVQARQVAKEMTEEVK